MIKTNKWLNTKDQSKNLTVRNQGNEISIEIRDKPKNQYWKCPNQWKYTQIIPIINEYIDKFK